MKKCMVTGATGHVGSALIKELLHAGWDVTAFILPGESLLPFEGAKPTILRGDVRDPYAVLRHGYCISSRRNRFHRFRKTDRNGTGQYRRYKKHHPCL